MTVQPKIVLADGAWADGSSWGAVIGRLQADGYSATPRGFLDPRWGRRRPSGRLVLRDVDNALAGGTRRCERR